MFVACQLPGLAVDCLCLFQLDKILPGIGHLSKPAQEPALKDNIKNHTSNMFTLNGTTPPVSRTLLDHEHWQEFQRA
jgi:hypothetical protein